jgi:hypothetical protein
MLHHIRVIPLAAESLGVRSMCTYVETADVRLLLDAGISLCPNRFGLPPHPEEFKTINALRRKIAEAAEKAEVITLSHYHFDHHTPSYEDWLCNWTAASHTAQQIYQEKTVLIKNPKEKINFSQRRRAWMFQKTAGKLAKKLTVADGKSFVFNKTRIRFSEPVFHGVENTPLGWVLITTVEYENERLMYAPDVQGPFCIETLKIILKEKPQMLIIGGPPSYLAGFRVKQEEVSNAIRHLEVIASKLPIVILEHHLLRDIEWREKIREVFKTAEKAGHRVLTAAEFMGSKNLFLEANRRRFYAEQPPSKEFERWMKLSDIKKRCSKPPI